MKRQIFALMSFFVLCANGDPAPRTGASDNYPSLSSDGSTMVFTSNRSGRQAIWIADAQGKAPRLLFDGGSDRDPSTPDWSPDGRLIVFAMTPANSSHPDESEIYTMRADGSGLRRLTTSLGDDSHPHWSADGKRIYFNSARATPDPAKPWPQQWIDIYSMAADGSDVRRHTDCKSVCTYPSPSPDGRYVAHRRVVDTLGLQWDLTPAQRNSEVFLTAIDGSGSINLSSNPGYDGWPTWSPDGSWVIFASNRDRVANTGQIYAVRPDGTGLRRLTATQWSYAQPRVTSVGDRVLVAEGLESKDWESYHVAEFPFSPIP